MWEGGSGYSTMKKTGSGNFPIHIIICPFCEAGLPIPDDFDAIYKCECGACYKVCSSETLERGVYDIAGELWSDEELDFIQHVPFDVCNIVIEKDFDRLLDIRQASDAALLERFCKYDARDKLSLVWIKRLV